jgi:hypothetical protein
VVALAPPGLADGDDDVGRAVKVVYLKTEWPRTGPPGPVTPEQFTGGFVPVEVRVVYGFFWPGDLLRVASHRTRMDSTMRGGRA